MGLRLLDYPPQPNNVIPLRAKDIVHDDRVGLDPGSAPPPEPVQLYHLIVLTFLLHVPTCSPEVCACCDRAWPCSQVRLAFRLREGF